jgi:hypothetical protein
MDNVMSPMQVPIAFLPMEVNKETPFGYCLARFPFSYLIPPVGNGANVVTF